MLGALLFALCSVSEAQQPKKVPRIGYLSSSDPLLSPPVPKEFAKRYMTLDTWKDRTSPSSTDIGGEARSVP